MESLRKERDQLVMRLQQLEQEGKARVHTLPVGKHVSIQIMD